MSEDIISSIKDRLTPVGMADTQEEVQLPFAVGTRKWVSTYAHFYLIPELDRKHKSWRDVLPEIDSFVRKALLREELETGGVLDAHVCFLVDGDDLPSGEDVDERLLRQVSRKYWIKRDESAVRALSAIPVLATPTLPAASTETRVALDKADEEWLENLVSNGAAKTFEALLTSLGEEP